MLPDVVVSCVQAVEAGLLADMDGRIGKAREELAVMEDALSRTKEWEDKGGEGGEGDLLGILQASLDSCVGHALPQSFDPRWAQK